MPKDNVPNTLLRGAVVKEVEKGRSWRSISEAAGINVTASAGQTLKRYLGVEPTYTTKKKVPYGPYFQKTLRYELALRIAHAINVDPVDVGL